MNQYVITLLSKKPCELNRFLVKYFDQKISVEEGTFRWSASFLNALDSSLLLATLVDNMEDYQIEAFISIEHQQNIEVCKENITGIIKYLYLLESKAS